MTRETRAHPLHDRLRRHRQHPAHREVHDAATLLALTRRDASLTGWRLQGLDLAPHADHLAGVDVRGMVVLGGHVPKALAHDLVARGAVVIPEDPTCPVDPFRATLYTARGLYDGLETGGYASTVDARAYAWSRERHTQHDAWATLLRAMHDDAMQDALVELLHGRAAVGVMGGHALERGGRDYADAARLGRSLADAGLMVLTGGGPGAMEAANLGASAHTDASLDAAVARIAEVPSFRPSIDEWALAGFAALELLEEAAPKGGAAPRSVGVPTWFYGHEPPNVFCDAVAKYFSNPLREDVLLSSSTAGLIVLPGAAGTVQEIFQAATPLYYADEEDPLPPVVLVGRSHWTETLPVWPALRALGADRPLGRVIHLVETTEEAARLVLAP